MAVGPSQRSQQQRAEQTRAALLEATIDLIHLNGLNRTSTNDIAAAAGVSRGALTHHFATREELIATAIEHMLHQAIDELTAFSARFTGGAGSSDDLIDFLWDLMSRRLFPVTMEFLPEARQNADFRTRLLPVVSAWHRALDRIWAELAERYDVAPAFAETVLNSTLCLMRGMIAQTVLREDPPYYAALLAYWKGEVWRQLTDAARSGPPKHKRAAARA